MFTLIWLVDIIDLSNEKTHGAKIMADFKVGDTIEATIPAYEVSGLFEVVWVAKHNAKIVKLKQIDGMFQKLINVDELNIKLRARLA